MNTAVLQKLLRELKNPNTSSLYIAFKDKLSEFNFDKTKACNQQWLETWLETRPGSAIRLIDEGVYITLSIRETILEQLVLILEKRLSKTGSKPNENPSSTVELITQIEIERWFELELDWLLTLLSTIYCNENEIDNQSINPLMNGRFSIYAASYNDRVQLTTEAIEYMDRGTLNLSNIDKLLDYFGAFFLLTFCQDDMLKQRIINICGDL